MGKKKETDKTDKNKLKKQTIIKSITAASTVLAACEAADICPDTFYRWYNTNKKFKKAIDVAKKSRIQAVENALFKSATDGNITAQIFFLCNRAKDEWESVNKVEHSGNIKTDNKLVIEIIKKQAEKK